MPAPGSELRVTVEPNFTAGAFGRLTIKDLFRAGMTPNRIFTFYSYDIWGTGILEKAGKVAPAPLRLADGRELPVTLSGNVPVVDWSRLAKVREMPGFKTLGFEMPFDGHVSLNLRNKDGVVVRQLLTDHPYVKGSHEVKWDGLPTPHYRTPGEPLPAGEYTWEAMANPGLTPHPAGLGGCRGHSLGRRAGHRLGWRPRSAHPAPATAKRSTWVGTGPKAAGVPGLRCRWKTALGNRQGNRQFGRASCRRRWNRLRFGLGRRPWPSTFSPPRQGWRLRQLDFARQRRTGRARSLGRADGQGPNARPRRRYGRQARRALSHLQRGRFPSGRHLGPGCPQRKLLADATVGPRLLKQVNPRFHERLQNWLAGQMKEEDAFCLHSVQGPWWKFELPEGLTRLLDRTDLAPGTDGQGPMSRGAGQPPLSGRAVRWTSASAQDGTVGRVRCRLGPLSASSWRFPTWARCGP